MKIPVGATVGERLGAWIATVRVEDVPQRVLELARHQLVNVVASIHAGTPTEEARAVERAVARHATPGRVTVLPTGERWSLADALTVSSARSMALDYDDYLYLGHTGHSAVLASLAIAELEGRTMDELLLAQVVANEIAGRVGASCVLGPQNGQAWSFIHAAGAAAAGAKILGLDAARTAHALAIALYQPTFTLWPGFMGPGSKVLTAAGPTIAGVQAAYCAAEGLTGAREIFEHRRKGLWRFFSFVPIPHAMTGLGRSWVTDTLAFKRYPGCAYIDTTMDALFRLLDQQRVTDGHALAPEAIERIEVDASLLTVEMDNLSAEHRSEVGLSAVFANFSIPLSVAIGVVAAALTPRELEPEFLAMHETTLRALASRVVLRHDWGATLTVAEAFDGAFGSSSVVAALRLVDFWKVARGYARELGGRRSHGLDLAGLLGAHRRRLRAALRRGRARRADARLRGTRPDLGSVDLTAFRMAFPATVTIVLHDGRRLCATQEVPVGAPGENDRLAAVRAKCERELGRRHGGEAAGRLASVLDSGNSPGIADLIALACARPPDDER
ncbi:MAG: MmgE/PrpD family protein [bacterium]